MEIWKFGIECKDSQTLIMPKLAEILTVQIQNGLPHIWVAVDPEAERSEKVLHVYGTGQSIDAIGKRYIGTYQFWAGVWHVFEIL